MYHGLSVYNKFKGMDFELVERAILAQNVEACWSDRPLGEHGLFCDIEHAEKVKCLVSCDAWSEVDRFGSREPNWQYSDPYHFGGYCKWYEDDEKASYQDLLAASEIAANNVGKRRYCEIIAVASAAAVWVKRNASKRARRQARIIAKRLGLYLMTV